ncbi:MAG: hypothetical protein ACLRM2_13405 [Bacteroides ovatus]
MKILVSFSGGKDSQACLIQAFKQDVVGILRALGHVTYDFKYRKCME